MRWPGLPTIGPHRSLLGAFTVDALGSGFFLPFSVLLFAATTTMSVPTIGLALSIAALIRIPATAGAGMLLDRAGAKATVLLSNLLQAAGFLGYLAVSTLGELVAAALVVQLGNSCFWVAFPGLVNDVSAEGEQERWFGLINGLRAAGLGLGALVASVAVAVGGVDGYRAIVVVNALTYAVATALVRRDPVRSTTTRLEMSRSDQGWSAVMRDRAFLAFVGACLGFTYLSLAFALAVPVYLVKSLGFPPWAPGILLALNAAFGALAAGPVVAAIGGRRRVRVLIGSQISMAVAYGCLLLLRGSGSLAFALAMLVAVLVTATELVQGPTVSAIVNEAGAVASRGRYIAAYQMTFSIIDIVAPAVLTWTLARGSTATWGPLIAVALVDVAALAMLSGRLPALRRRVGARSSEGTPARTLESDSL